MKNLLFILAFSHYLSPLTLSHPSHVAHPTRPT